LIYSMAKLVKFYRNRCSRTLDFKKLNLMSSFMCLWVLMCSFMTCRITKDVK
jgi:hypothetical protein